jgi:hypothetical protein
MSNHHDKTKHSRDFIRLIAAISLGTISILCSSCGGSGSGDTPVTLPNPMGIWIGAGAYRQLGIISNSGSHVNIIYFIGDSQLRGSMGTSESGEIVSSTLFSFIYTGDIGSAYYLVNGTLVPKETIVASYETFTGSELTLDMQYDSLLTERPASLDIISGIWSDTAGTYSITITIDSGGNIFGSDTEGCTYTGSISVPNSSVNIYRVNFVISGCRYMPDGEGQAILIDTTTQNDTLVLAITGHTAALATKSFVRELTRQ